MNPVPYLKSLVGAVGATCPLCGAATMHSTAALAWGDENIVRDTFTTSLIVATLLLPIGILAQAPAVAAMPETFESQLRKFDSMSPDEVFARLRQYITALLSALPGFDPGNRLVDIVVERP